ncbi:MAG: ABC transporter ATP-binding protein [Lachnospiraceae bacterium]|nr:ABC transporter ATP-binding protein [Lachnospiraceae bacterium]
MKNSALKWLLLVPGKKHLLIVFLTLAQGLYGASGVMYALFLRNMVDAAAGHDKALFWRWIFLIVLLAAAQLLLRAIIRWLTELSKASLENIFKRRLTQTLLEKDYLRISAIHSGAWLNRLTNDTAVAANGCVEILPGLVEMTVKLISALVMIILLEPRFAAILLPGGALVALFSWLFRKVMKRLHKGVQEADGRARIFLQERIGSLLMIRSFAAEGQTLLDADEKLEGHKAARMRKNRFSNLCNIGFGAAMSGMYLLGAGWCGYGILTGTVSFGTLTAITQLVSQIQSPFANITGYLPKTYAMLASAERLMDAESFPAGAPAALPLSEISAFYRNKLSAFGLRDVSFAYYPASETAEGLSKEAMPAALEHVSLEIRKGEIAALTGQSGCGKSTALKLLKGVYEPDSGGRYYKTADGRVSGLTGAYRRLFAYVPQGNLLMSGSIREIVSFAEPKRAGDEGKLWRALQIVCAKEFVSELEQGIDTILGERGTGLSEGQMQRLAIARAIFSESPILLLDEATSALDAETEKRLLENLRQLTDKTVVIVTHRPAALSICDRVLHIVKNGGENVLDISR